MIESIQFWWIQQFKTSSQRFQLSIPIPTFWYKLSSLLFNWHPHTKFVHCYYCTHSCLLWSVAQARRSNEHSRQTDVLRLDRDLACLRECAPRRVADHKGSLERGFKGRRSGLSTIFPLLSALFATFMLFPLPREWTEIACSTPVKGRVWTLWVKRKSRAFL